MAVDGKQLGPFAMDTLKPFVQSGQLKRQTLVWCQGMAQWTPAGEVAELTLLFGQTPPPLPPK